MMRRRMTCIFVIALMVMLLSFGALADTIASGAVQLSEGLSLPAAKNGDDDEDEDDEGYEEDGDWIDWLDTYYSSNTERFTFSWLKHFQEDEETEKKREAYAYRITISGRDGKAIERETFYRQENGENKHSYTVQLISGFYTVKVEAFDDAMNSIGGETQRFYLQDNASIMLPVPGGERKASVGYKYKTSHQFNWYPVVDFESMKVVSNRYRIQILDMNVDADKQSNVIVDETTTKRSYLIRGEKLPKGLYTVIVTAYRGSEYLETYKLHLTVSNPGGVYDYTVDEHLDITPGEAITRQHAVGSKDMTLYGTVNTAAVQDLPMTALTFDGTALDVNCGGERFTAAMSEKTLVLSSLGDGWRISQKALSVLKASGVDDIRLTLSDGTKLSIPTDLEFEGRHYARLRALGYVSKDFILKVKDGALAVECDGTTYDLAGREIVPVSVSHAAEGETHG